MARQVQRAACVTLVFIALGATASPAGGDGLPVGNIDAGGTGIAGPGDARYVTIPAGARTVVARIDRRNGRVMRSAAVRGNFTIPAVALDASAAGLSADGETLVLIRPRARYPQSRTELLVLDAQRLRAVRRVNLRGDFSFDAVSPNGGSIYLVEYLSRRDPTRYAVRTYDLERGRLLAAPVVDKSEPGEQMRGYPVTRLDGPGGRWAYTLYDGAGGHPFVHALDTVEQTAVCIDLDGLTGRKDLQALRLVTRFRAGAIERGQGCGPGGADRHAYLRRANGGRCGGRGIGLDLDRSVARGRVCGAAPGRRGGANPPPAPAGDVPLARTVGAFDVV